MGTPKSPPPAEHEIQSQLLRKLNQAENIIKALDELLRKEYRGQPEMAMIKKMIDDFKEEWND
jgi:hypothetical protein